MDTDNICARISELIDAIDDGPGAVAREFTRSIPAQPERDADIVLTLAIVRLRELEAEIRVLSTMVIVAEGRLTIAREAFRKYGKHDRLCGFVGGYGSCSCGFDEALKQINSEGE